MNSHTFRALKSFAEAVDRTVLSSSGNDGRIRLWKATSGGNVWRTAGSVGVEQAEEREDEEQRKEDERDVDMTAS